MGIEGKKVANSSRVPSSRRIEVAIERAARYRVVTAEQLRRIGLTPAQIRHRVAAARLVPIHRNIYAVGSAPLDDEGRWRAAVLAAGPGALLSHNAGAAHWRMIRGAAIIDVTAPRRMHRQPGIRFHRCEVPRDEATVRHGIPVVCPARAILDLAATVTGRPLERALNEARVLRLPERPSLRELIDRYPGRRGIRAAREALALFEAGPTPTRSELEERFLALIDRCGLPRPLLNRRVRTEAGTFRVDCIWPELRVIVELDAWSTHSGRQAMLADRRRDRALRIAGWHPSRVSGDDFDDEARLISDLRALLAPPADRQSGHRAA